MCWEKLRGRGLGCESKKLGPIHQVFLHGYNYVSSFQEDTSLQIIIILSQTKHFQKQSFPIFKASPYSIFI